MNARLRSIARGVAHPDGPDRPRDYATAIDKPGTRIRGAHVQVKCDQHLFV
jgi:hypothetical protein